MKLTDAEYQKFKTQFHCTAWPDEQYRIPVDVDTPAGTGMWTAYIEGARFHAGVDWVSRLRGNSTGLVNASMITAPANQEPIRYAVTSRVSLPGGQAVRRTGGGKKSIKWDLTTGLLVVMVFLGGIYFYVSRIDPSTVSIHKSDAGSPGRTAFPTPSGLYAKGR